MKYYTYWFALICLPCLFSCDGDSSGNGDSDDGDVINKSFDDFVAEVNESVGEGAVDCGVVEIGESQVTTNTCVAESFVNEQSFVAIYQQQGIDSSVAAAITGNGEGNIMKWHYDSNPSGGVPASSSVIESDECVNASLTGSVDSGFDDIFSCD